MKLVVQRVTSASVEVDGNIVGEIDEGLMVLVGFGQSDTTKEADYLAGKLAKLRIFEDENGRMNKSHCLRIRQLNCLTISQTNAVN